MIRISHRRTSFLPRNNNYFLCWAIPLLRLCLTQPHHLPNRRSWHLFDLRVSSFACTAFSPTTLGQHRSVPERSLRFFSSNEPSEQPFDWSSLRVADLKEELKKRGLKRAGRKADLVALLEQDDNTMSRRSSPRKKQKTEEATASPPPVPKPAKKAPAKKAAAGDHQRITAIDELPKLWTQEMAKANGSYSK